MFCTWPHSESEAFGNSEVAIQGTHALICKLQMEIKF